MTFSVIVFLVLVGLLPSLIWFFPSGQTWDHLLYRWINLKWGNRWLDWLFKGLWPLGTVWLLLVLLPGVALLSWRLALFLALGLLYNGGVERVLKVGIRRQRPFREVDDAILRQPCCPTDPSFPSGDAARVAFIAVMLAVSFSLDAIWMVALLTLVAGVSIGRVYLGAHYPTDAWAGAWLGCVNALLWLQLYPYWLHSVIAA